MPFNSQEFREFAANYEFEVTTSSTSYPQSISEAENAIKTTNSCHCWIGGIPHLKVCPVPLLDVLTQNENTTSHHQSVVKANDPREFEGETSQAGVQTYQVLQPKHQRTSAFTDR